MTKDRQSLFNQRFGNDDDERIAKAFVSTQEEEKEPEKQAIESKSEANVQLQVVQEERISDERDIDLGELSQIKIKKPRKIESKPKSYYLKYNVIEEIHRRAVKMDMSDSAWLEYIVEELFIKTKKAQG